MGGSLIFEEIKDVYTRYPIFNKTKYFVETGTYKGDTTMMASEHFEHVYTMEIMKALYDESSKRASDSKVDNITFCLGDSVQILPQILPSIQDGSFFFIDAHQSGGDTGNNNKQRVPLYEELDLILNSDIGPSVFIFNDLRFWEGENQEVWDWVHISKEKIITKFENLDYNVIDSYSKNDRFYVITV